MISSKISIVEIVRKHNQTLVNHDTKKRSWRDLFTFYFIPVFLGLLLLSIMPTSISNSKDIINIVITTLSIFIGLFMNLTVLLIDFYNKNNFKLKELLIAYELIAYDDIDSKEKTKTEIESHEVVKDVAKETIYSIFYSIFISVVTIVVCLLTYINFFNVKKAFINMTIEYTRDYIAIISSYDPIHFIEKGLHFLIYGLAIHFLLILLMIVKRFSKIVNSQIS